MRTPREAEVASSARTSPKTLAELAERFPQEVARNPNASVETLAGLCALFADDVARNPALRLEVGRTPRPFAGWPSTAVATLAGSRFLPPVVLEGLMLAFRYVLSTPLDAHVFGMLEPRVRRAEAAMLASGLLRNPNLPARFTLEFEPLTRELARWDGALETGSMWADPQAAQAHLTNPHPPSLAGVEDVVLGVLRRAQLSSTDVRRVWASVRFPAEMEKRLATRFPSGVLHLTRPRASSLVAIFARQNAPLEVRAGVLLHDRLEPTTLEQLAAILLRHTEHRLASHEERKLFATLLHHDALPRPARADLAAALQEQRVDLTEVEPFQPSPAQDVRGMLEEEGADPFLREEGVATVREIMERENVPVLTALAIGYRHHPMIERMLASHPSTAVRLALALNPHRSQEATMRLIEDGDMRVRSLVRAVGGDA